MSDLSATNCGCNNGGSRSSNGFSNIIWIILLLSFCGGCGNNGNGISLFGGDNNSGCENLILLLLVLSCCCGNNNY